MTSIWSVTVTVNGEEILTIDTQSLSGKADLSDEELDAIRFAGHHLLGFVGESRPCVYDPSIPF
jgi:hypothetical protein